MSLNTVYELVSIIGALSVPTTLIIRAFCGLIGR